MSRRRLVDDDDEDVVEVGPLVLLAAPEPCFRFREADPEPVVNAEVPGMESLSLALDCVPFTEEWPRRVLAAGPLSCSVADEDDAFFLLDDFGGGAGGAMSESDSPASSA